MKIIINGQEVEISGGSGGGGSSEEVYSTEETRIGTWIDGKPLYRKGVFIPKLTLQRAETVDVGGYSFPPKNVVEKIVLVKGSAKRTDGGSLISLPFFGPNFDLLISESLNSWVLNSYGYAGTFDIDISIDYTKTTDEGGTVTPSRSGGNPVGTVISFLGMVAPAGYLVCDGAEHEITAYPALADFFRQQFGTANHFGGDGTNTFAVPDLRNLFLRGYHGESEEQLSGEIGARQEATEHIDLGGKGGLWVPNHASPYLAKQPDSLKDIKQSTSTSALRTDPSGPQIGRFTSRPVNMAVLKCVKAK